MELKELIGSAIDIGYHMLNNGAEVFRVEQSIEFICKAYGAKEVDVFAIPTSIVVTVSNGNDFYTKTKRVTGYQTNLDKVEQLNNLSRYICLEKPDRSTINKMLKDILNRPQYNLMTQILAYSLISYSFALFFGGNQRDAIVAALVGAFARIVIAAMLQLRANAFFVNILSSMVITAISLQMISWNFADHFDKLMIGVLMTLVPGVALANCMRDFIAHDIVAGLSRLAEALLTATGIAIGVAVILLAAS
jgi:uncharacterized membrane protein YjjP (DUF1212 family)